MTVVSLNAYRKSRKPEGAAPQTLGTSVMGSTTMAPTSSALAAAMQPKVEHRSTQTVSLPDVEKHGAERRASVLSVATCEARIEKVLFGGTRTGISLPDPIEMLRVLLSLTDCSAHKALLPLPIEAAEYAFLRRGESVLVSYYLTDESPDVVVRDRRVILRDLTQLVMDLVEATAAEADTTDERRVCLMELERARQTAFVFREDSGLSAVRKRGGSFEAPESDKTLSFGFEAAIFPSPQFHTQASNSARQSMAMNRSSRPSLSHADVHAMLFSGHLWAWALGKRVTLSKGPILLCAQRMVSAVRALTYACEERKALNIRLRQNGFGIGMRREISGEILLTLGCEEDGFVTVPALDLQGVGLPILRLASELLRAVVQVDRSQTRNLRIVALRDEVRRLRREVLRAKSGQSFVNLEKSIGHWLDGRSDSKSSARKDANMEAKALRYNKRWDAVIDGLDAASSHLTKDLWILSTARRTMAIHRHEGTLIWEDERGSSALYPTAQSIVRVAADGKLEALELETGEVLAEAKIQPRAGIEVPGLVVDATHLPPMVILPEGRNKLVALDARTLSPRWKMDAKGAPEFRMKRVGRILYLVSAERWIRAIDVLSGAVLWQYEGDARYCLMPEIRGEKLYAVTGEPGRTPSAMHVFDAVSGELLREIELGICATSAPVAGKDHVVVAGLHQSRTLKVREDDYDDLEGHAQETHKPQDQHEGDAILCIVDSDYSISRTADVGMAHGAGTLILDQRLFVNSPRGYISAVDLASGSVVWNHRMADPVCDDVPRNLEPVLCNGALYVPSAQVHVLRPNDGKVLTKLDSELIPDTMRVDSRGWVYVGEESGHIEAHAVSTQLALLEMKRI